MVGIESSQWGNYRGLIQSETASSVSHGDMVGMTQFFGNPAFKANLFFKQLIHELKEMQH